MFKRILVFSLTVLALCLLVPGMLYLVVDDATLTGWAKEKLADASGIEISSLQPIHLTRTLSPTLSARELVVRDPDNGFQIEASLFELQISLPALILGKLDIRQLHIGASRVVTTGERTTTDPTDLITLLRTIDNLPLQPVLHDVKIEQITIVEQGHEDRLPELQVNQLAFRHTADNNVTMRLEGLQIDSDAVDFEAEFPPIHRVLKDGKAPFNATVYYQTAELKATGLVDLDTEPATLTATLDVTAENLDRLPTGMESLVIPGSLTATAKLFGNSAQLSLQDLSANWYGPDQSTIELKGSLGDILQLEQTELQFDANLQRPDWLRPLLPDSMQDLKTIALSSHISGSAQTLVFDQFKLHSMSTEELEEQLTGKLELHHASTRPELANMDLEYRFSAPTTLAARTILFPSVPEFGRINGRAKVSSTHDHPSLQNIEVTTRDEKGIQVRLTGSIASFPLDAGIPNEGYDLAVHIAADSTSLITGRMGVELPINGPFSTDFRIEGATQSLRLEKIVLTSGSHDKVQLQANGFLHFGSWDQVDPLNDINLDLHLRSRDTQALATLFDQPTVPELGPLQARAKVSSQSGKHRIGNIELSTAETAPLSARVTGSAEKLLIAPQFRMDDIRLQAVASTSDVSVLQTVLDTSHAIPAIGPLQASAAISGSSETLSVETLVVNAGDSQILQLRIRGMLGRFAASEDWRMRDTDLRLNVSAPESQALADKLGYRIPDLGPISGTATIKDESGKTGIRSAKFVVGNDDNPAINVEGMMDSFVDPGTSHWTIELDINGQNFAAMIGDESLPELGDLHGKAIISDSDGSTGIDSLELTSDQPGILTINLHGDFTDFDKLETLSLDSKVTARDLQLLEPLTGLPWLPLGPVEWNTRISHRNNNLVLTSSISAEETRIDADIIGILTTKPPLFKGTIKANNMFISNHVERFAQSARERKKQRKEEQQKETKKTSKDADNPHIFSHTPLNIDGMRKFDLDIDVDIPRFNPKYALADSGKARIVLKSGKLSIDPVQLNYGEKSLNASLHLDSNDTPSLTFKASGHDLNPWRHLFSEDSKLVTNAFVDIDIDINTAGNSEHELASNSKGKAFASMQHGKLNEDMLHLLFVDVIGWAVSEISRNKYANVHCGVADFSIDSGVVSTRAFLIDTDNITITGEGTVDLGKETVDYVMLPKKKSRIIAKAEPVKITGDLSDPKIAALPLKSVAATYGSLIFGPVVFAGVFASQEILGRLNQKRNSDKESPCEKYKQAYEAMLTSDNAKPPAPAP